MDTTNSDAPCLTAFRTLLQKENSVCNSLHLWDLFEWLQTSSLCPRREQVESTCQHDAESVDLQRVHARLSYDGN